jgi:hypothetical protein
MNVLKIGFFDAVLDIFLESGNRNGGVNCDAYRPRENRCLIVNSCEKLNLKSRQRAAFCTI